MSETESVLVTGGGGFIGAWVMRELLARGLRPVLFDVRDNLPRRVRIAGESASDVPFIAGSLLDRVLLGRIMDEHRVRRVIHLAAVLTPLCQTDPWTGAEVNVMGTLGLFEQIAARKERIAGVAWASSLAAFGSEADEGLPQRPRGNHPQTFYGAFKRAAELIVEQFWLHHGIASVGIRPHIVYGPERTQGLSAGPSLAIRAAAESESYCVGYTGRAGYDYVADVATAFVRSALETPPGATFIGLPSQLATTHEFVELIDRVIPGAAQRLSINGPSIPLNESPDNVDIRSLFPDWRATTIEEGIRRTAAFYGP